MPWWVWLALGATLLVVEVAVQTEFWLAVLGVAALIVGIAAWMGFGGCVVLVLGAKALAIFLKRPATYYDD